MFAIELILMVITLIASHVAAYLLGTIHDENKSDALQRSNR